MAKKKINHFKITAYYSGNTCIIDEKHSFLSCEILCKLFNYNAVDIVSVRDDLKNLLQLLLFKFDSNYAAWENYDSNVYKAQSHLNFIKELLLKLPLYKHTVHHEEGFEDADEHYSFYEDPRYKSKDYDFYDSHVLEEVSTLGHNVTRM